MELLIVCIPALLYSTFIGSMARRRSRATACWMVVTFIAAFVFFMGSMAIPSLSPGTKQVVFVLLAISGFVWCALAPILVCVGGRKRVSRS